MGPHKLEIETKALQFPGMTLEQTIQYFATLLVETDHENKVVQSARLLLALHRLKSLGRTNLFRCLDGIQKSMTEEELTHLFEKVQASHVYVMADVNQRYKIGKADDPSVRRQNISTGTPGGAELIEVFICREGNAFKVEKRAKELLAKHRIKGGEWFNCDRESAAAAVRAAYQEVFGRDYEDGEVP